jgi:hypothetical protein
MEAIIKMDDLIYFVISYIIVLLVGFLLIQFLSNGFFTTFLKVKASRGKKVLIKVNTISDTYYTSGFINEGFLKYKKRRTKDFALIKIPNKDCIYRAIGVNCIDIDDENNAVLKSDLTAVSGFDAVKMDNLLVRALMKPKLKSKQDAIITLAIIIGAIALCYLAYQTFSMQDKINLILENTKRLKEVGII